VSVMVHAARTYRSLGKARPNGGRVRRLVCLALLIVAGVTGCADTAPPTESRTSTAGRSARNGTVARSCFCPARAITYAGRRPSLLPREYAIAPPALARGDAVEAALRSERPATVVDRACRRRRSFVTRAEVAYSQPRSVAIRTACARSTAPSLP
jgi:hypothetical protein